VRVLLCVDALGVGGKERQAVELARGLAATAGMDVRVVTFERADFYLADLERAGMAVDFLARRMRWDPGLFRTLYQVIKSFRPDVIHTNGLVSSFYAWPLAKWRHIPVVNGSIRNAFAESDLRWRLERLLLAASDYRVANSRAGLRSRNLDQDNPRNVVIYNGFDFARVDGLVTNDDGTTPLVEGNRTTVGMVAEFNRNKDYLTFIEVARRLSRTGPTVEFVAVGDGETLRECQTAAEGLTTFRFLGKRKNVEEIVRGFDIGVLSTFVEGLSNSIMEYMALGKPVVATDAGGTRELGIDGETGFLVAPSDPAAMSSAIERLIDDPRLATRMGRAGRARLMQQCSLSRMLDETVALYRRAIAASR
jgi:glycosyltransferase involved in cell wall biosynthesis